METQSTEKIMTKARRMIADHNLFFIEDICAMIPISKATFYKYVQDGSNELNEIKELLDANRAKTKVALRQRFYKSDSPVLQVALYKLIGTDEERKKLNQAYIESKTEVVGGNRPFVILTQDEIEALNKVSKK